MKFIADDALIECAKIRYRCSCLEEYLIERDLKLDLSKIERIFDFIEIVEKHPKISTFINVDNASLVPTAIMLFGSCFSFLITFATNMMFPYFDSNIYMISFSSYTLGVCFIVLAFCLKVLDAEHALLFYR